MNILTGDPEAGRAYFEGAGTCRNCLYVEERMGRVHDGIFSDNEIVISLSTP